MTEVISSKTPASCLPILRLGGSKHRVEFRWWRTEPNAKLVLFVYEAGTDILIATVEVGDPVSCAQACYEIELQANGPMERGSTEFNRKVRSVRKALGFSIP